ncbi:MAG: 1-acyl-sn-glycerol-3-phosphate acyltransferase [Clostridiales bacterium]|nr:1-acyl-sn-glycerol-3-phosphate acyltransferase [Clostridiales bacterium]MBE5807601.1 1-acyl-sn-glycerol-3-phosphate acyltransferase [Clostridiales bacterium]
MNRDFYRRLRGVLRPFYNLFWPSTVTGLENIPREGGFIMCANHVHWRDPLFLAVRMPVRYYVYLGKAELYKNPIAARILGDKGLGGIPINRGEADIGAVRKALAVVKEGHALGIFPQGTRSRDNTPTPMLNGVSMIAVRAGAPIIPVYLDGPYRLFHHVDVRIGEPVDIADLGRKYDAATLTEVTHRIEKAIWGMREGIAEA